jgi:hypothetical protein
VVVDVGVWVTIIDFFFVKDAVSIVVIVLRVIDTIVVMVFR